MKTVLACVGAFGLLVLGGPLHQPRFSDPTPGVMPAWLNLPARGELASIETYGNSGTVTFYLGEDAGAQLSEMKDRLVADGFVVEEPISSVDTFMGVTNFAVAQRPITGQALRMVLIETPTGHLLRVSYDEEISQIASAH